MSLFLAACGGGDSEDVSSDNGEDNTEGQTGEDTGSETEGENAAGADIEEQTWRFYTEETKTQLQYLYAEEFAKRIDEKTGGKVTVQPYEYGSTGSETDQVKQVQQGAAEMAIMSPGFTGNMVQEGQIFALHFLFPDSVEKTQEILTNSEALNTDLRKRYEEYGLSPLAFWTEGAMAWTSNVGLETPEDFEGLKMRVQESPLMIKSYEQYGASPQSLSWSELYTGLDRGTVEGQENPVFFIYDAAFHEVQDTMTLSKHNNYVAMTTVNTEWYNGLSDQLKTIVDETVADMQSWAFNKQKELNNSLLEEMKNDEEDPTEIIELSEEQRATFRELALPMQEYYKNNVSEVDGEILEKLKGEIEEATAE